MGQILHARCRTQISYHNPPAHSASTCTDVSRLRSHVQIPLRALEESTIASRVNLNTHTHTTGVQPTVSNLARGHAQRRRSNQRSSKSTPPQCLMTRRFIIHWIWLFGGPARQVLSTNAASTSTMNRGMVSWAVYVGLLMAIQLQPGGDLYGCMCNFLLHCLSHCVY